MRSKVLGLATAAVAAGALTLGVPTPASHAAAWKTVAGVPFPAGVISDVAVVSTGDGDAVAAAIIDGAVHASTATNGVWAPSATVRGDVDATRLVLTSDQAGDTAVGWVENVAGDDRLRVARQTSPTTWTGQGLVPMTPAGTDVSGVPEIGISGDGRVIAVATLDGGDSNHELVVNEWPKGGTPGSPHTISASDSWNPALDVNSKGEALVAYNYTGLVDDVLNVVRRSAGGTWNIGDSTSNSGNIASAPDVAISENGRGQVIYGVVATEAYMAETSHVQTDGTALPGKILSSTPEFISDPTVDIDASGTALFAWTADKDGTTSVRYATAADKAYPSAPQTLAGTLPDAERPIARISDEGLRMIQHSGNGKVTTHHRASSISPFAAATTGTGYSVDTDLDVDAHGNGVMVGIQGGTVQARFMDAGSPDLALAGPAPTTVATTIPLTWTASDSLSALQPGTDLYLSTSRWNQSAFTSPAVAESNAPGTGTSYAAIPGATYCFQAVVSDTAGNGATSAKRCTTVPLDDVSLAGSGWTRAAKAGQFKSTWTTTATKGRTLTRSGIKAKSLALVANRLSNGGLVEVRWNGTLLKKISLKGTTSTKKVYPIVTWAGLHTGTVTIKVISATGRPVRIDGLVVAK